MQFGVTTPAQAEKACEDAGGTVSLAAKVDTLTSRLCSVAPTPIPAMPTASTVRVDFCGPSLTAATACGTYVFWERLDLVGAAGILDVVSKKYGFETPNEGSVSLGLLPNVCSTRPTHSTTWLFGVPSKKKQNATELTGVLNLVISCTDDGRALRGFMHHESQAGFMARRAHESANF